MKILFLSSSPDTVSLKEDSGCGYKRWWPRSIGACLDLASPTIGRIVAAFNCSLAAGGSSWQEKRLRTIIIIIVIRDGEEEALSGIGVQRWAGTGGVVAAVQCERRRQAAAAANAQAAQPRAQTRPGMHQPLLSRDFWSLDVPSSGWKSLRDVVLCLLDSAATMGS